MKHLLTILILFPFLAAAAPTGDEAADYEQDFLTVNYSLENGYGFRADTLHSLELYRAVLRWLGTPYRYSGSDDDGMDCSGFVSAVVGEAFGLTLAASSRDMYSDNVVPVERTDLQEGDLVFFRIRSRHISHVGIYLGNGRFAHASRSRGVTISSLESSYYKKYFFHGGRLKPMHDDGSHPDRIAESKAD
jgi:lipoprotein Spr